MNDPMIECVAARSREDAIAWTSDARLAKQFSTKREATAAASAAGGEPTKIDRMGFMLWAIIDDQGRYITETGCAFATRNP